MKSRKLLGFWIRENKDPMPVIIYGEIYNSQCKEPERFRVTKRHANPMSTFTIPKKEVFEYGFIEE